MQTIQTFDLMDPENRLKAKDVFNTLTEHLRVQHLLPDKHFVFNKFGFKPDGMLPACCTAKCDVELDGDRAVNLTINMEFVNDAGERTFDHFAFGQSLDASADGFFKMCRIAAECNLILNGGGVEFSRKNVDITLTRSDAAVLLENCYADIIELELPEQQVAALKTVCAQLRTSLGTRIERQSNSLSIT